MYFRNDKTKQNDGALCLWIIHKYKALFFVFVQTYNNIDKKIKKLYSNSVIENYY